MKSSWTLLSSLDFVLWKRSWSLSEGGVQLLKFFFQGLGLNHLPVGSGALLKGSWSLSSYTW